MRPKLHIKKGDLVLVLAGDSKGQQGQVLKVFPEKMRAIVEGINLISKHAKPSAKNPKGGIEKKESSIHISNLKHVETSVKAKTKATEIKEKKTRSSKKTVEESK